MLAFKLGICKLDFGTVGGLAYEVGETGPMVVVVVVVVAPPSTAQLHILGTKEHPAEI